MVPVKAFNAPPQTESIKLILVAACCDIITGQAIESCSSTIVFPYNSLSLPAQVVSLPLKLPANSISIVAAGLEYYTNKSGMLSLYSDELFRPAAVICEVVNVL